MTLTFNQQWKNTKRIVGHVLDNNPLTRASDAILVLKTYEEITQNELGRDHPYQLTDKELKNALADTSITDDRKNIYPEVGWITRSRRDYQKAGKYTPPEHVEKRRKQLEQLFKNHFSNNTNQTTAEQLINEEF